MTDGLADLAAAFEGRPADEILREAARRFPGRLTFATGLGAEGCVLVDLIGRNGLDVDLFILDTGVLFTETYELQQRLEAKYGLTIRAVKPERTIDEQAAAVGPSLWARDPDRCCDLRKVAPLRAELSKFDAWVTAIRRDQTAERAASRTFEPDRKFGLVKVNPLVAWTHKDVWNHLVRNDVPYNPLHDHGFPSIGCRPCTSEVRAGEDARAGRWRGQEKKECGLHIERPSRLEEAKLTPLMRASG